MAYARRSTKRRTPTSRYRATARRSFTATRGKRKTARRRASPSGGRTIRLVIEHAMPNDTQRPVILSAAADRKDRNQKRTF